MKAHVIFISIIFFQSTSVAGQTVDFYGPASFCDIEDRSFVKSWMPAVIPAIENREYVIILNTAQDSVIVIDTADFTQVLVQPVGQIHKSGATYGSLMRSIFQIVDINTHLENDDVALAGVYTLNPILHSYYALNMNASDEAQLSDAGHYYITEHLTYTGYLHFEFSGATSATKVKAIDQWEYNSGSEEFDPVGGWTDRWLKLGAGTLSWTLVEAEATSFFLASPDSLIDLKIADGSDFNPVSVQYQSNATAELPVVDSMENSSIIDGLSMDIDDEYELQFGNSTTAGNAASAMLDSIECTLISNGDALRYPKDLYLAARDNMLSHTLKSTDVYNGRVGFNTIAHVYFTNEKDDLDVPHPFMVVAAHALSTRPNLLLDVNRPPGAEMGVGYNESTVTRHGKLGEFLIKIPLKDYGLISTLLDNDLSPYGDLASDYDASHGGTTTKDVYNYAGTASIGVAVDGVTIYPAYNNNLKFAVEDGEVTSSGIHVGVGLELHYHADGHAFNGNGINLYNAEDYVGHNHPPLLGFSYDGIAIFARYDDAHTSMLGYSEALDIYGGHDHDDLGYHYHAHTQTVTASSAPNPIFDEHFLLVGAWKGAINHIPGFLQVKKNQLMDNDIKRYAGASHTPSTCSGDTIIWNGTVSTNWNDPLNWSPNQIPTGLDDVQINPGTPFSPHIDSGVQALAKTLMILQSAVFSLDLTGTLEVGN